MTHTLTLERIAPLQEASKADASAEYALNVTVLYEDGPTHQWAVEMCERVARLVGKEAVRGTWWKISELTEPAVLAGAVSTALRADVIVVALHAAEGLPLPFYVWVDSWLPHRAPAAAALVALIGLPDKPSVQLDRAREYLQAVARQGRLDFLLEERKLRLQNQALGGDNDLKVAEAAALKRARSRFPERVNARSFVVPTVLNPSLAA